MSSGPNLEMGGECDWGNQLGSFLKKGGVLIGIDLDLVRFLNENYIN